jgi:microcystin-dependent protein
MAEPFLAEIRMMSFAFPPKGWARCDGQLLPINQNQALFSLLGTTYGGDGRVNFALPDLRARGPMHRGVAPVGGGSEHTLGEGGGEVAHTLTAAEMPAHTHALVVVNRPGTRNTPGGNFLAAHRGGYAEAGNVAMHSGAIGNAGGSQPHANMPPYLTISFCIALQGIFPSQT